MAKQQNFTQFLRERGTPDLDSADHSMYSPSGHVSDRAREDARKRESDRLAKLGEAQKEFRRKIDAGEIVDPTGRYRAAAPKGNEMGERREILLRQAADFRHYAESGFKPRKHLQMAEKLEKEARELGSGKKLPAFPSARAMSYEERLKRYGPEYPAIRRRRNPF